MLVLVLGGAASGKSGIGEGVAVSLAGHGTKLYVATMEPFGGEALARVARHRKLRKSKGFDTLEHYRNLKSAKVSGYDTVLLECMSTLLANEFFENPNAKNDILSGIFSINSRSENLVVISNLIFSDGASYDSGTNSYMNAMAEINSSLAEAAEVVLEAVCGIPVIMKGEGYINECFKGADCLPFNVLDNSV